MPNPGCIEKNIAALGGELFNLQIITISRYLYYCIVNNTLYSTRLAMLPKSFPEVLNWGVCGGEEAGFTVKNERTLSLQKILFRDRLRFRQAFDHCTKLHNHQIALLVHLTANQKIRVRLPSPKQYICFA